MRTPFQQRCDQAWAAHRELELRLSAHVLRQAAQIVRSPATNLYAAADETADAVKLGIAASPAERASTLAVGNPNPVELKISVPAPAGLERALHDYLAPDRIRGEWFHATPAVLVVCELLFAAGDFQRDLASDEEPFDPELTVDVFCARANDLLDLVAEAA